MLIQVLLIVFFLIAIAKVVRRRRANELNTGAAAVWVIFWLVATAVVALPNSTFYLARLLGVGRGADAVVYVALVVLFFMVFRLMVRQEKLNKDITRLVRQEALTQARKQAEPKQNENTL